MTKSLFERARNKIEKAVWVPILLLTIGLLYFRNFDVVRNPLIYTEDGTWFGNGLTHGWFWALMNSKPDYYVFLNVGLLWFAGLLSKSCFGNILDQLPNMISVVSMLFYATFSTACAMFMRRRFGIFGGITTAILITFMPMGISANEILGRISNIGYVLLPLSTLLFIACEPLRVSVPKYLLFIFVQTVFCLTNPVIPLLLIALVLIENHKESINLRRRRNLIIVGMSILTLLINGIKLLSNPSITGLYVWSNFVKVFLGREIVYPLAFPIYKYLNDFSVIVIIVLLAFFVQIVIRNTNEFFKKEIILLLSALLLNIIATAFMRRSLTEQITDYRNTFPDRYFIGSNYLVYLIVVYLIFIGITKNKSKENRFRFSFRSSMIAILSLLITTYPGVIQYSKSTFPIGSKREYFAKMCQVNPSEVQKKNIQLELFPEGWYMSVPVEILTEFQSQHCSD